MRIVGIDPGKTTGMAIVDANSQGWRLVSRTDIPPAEAIRGVQLLQLYETLAAALSAADVCVMEEMLAYGKNSADEKVEAQAITKLAAAVVDTPLVTYAPATVRSVICRDGRADEKAIRDTLRFLARAPKTSKKGQGWGAGAHQYDALAVALCHMARIGMVLDRCEEAAA